MKTNKLAVVGVVVLLLVSVFWSGCERGPVDDSPYPFQCDLNYTVPACGVDSCLKNLPWLNTFVSEYMADTERTSKCLIIDYITFKEYVLEGYESLFMVYTDHGDTTFYKGRYYNEYYDCSGMMIDIPQKYFYKDSILQIGGHIQPVVHIDMPTHITSQEEFIEWYKEYRSQDPATWGIEGLH